MLQIPLLRFRHARMACEREETAKLQHRSQIVDTLTWLFPIAAQARPNHSLLSAFCLINL